MFLRYVLSLIVICVISFSFSTSASASISKSFGVDSGFDLLNEMQVNNPGGDETPCEYIEVRGDPNTSVGDFLYLIEVDGDGTQAGIVDFVFDLSTFSYGSNGLITIKGNQISGKLNSKFVSQTNSGISIPCGSRDYQTQGTTFVEDFFLNFENGTISFLLLRSQQSIQIQIGDDLDTNNDGTIDNLPGVNTIIVDAVGWTDGGASDFVYGGVDVTPGSTGGSPDAATRNAGNTMPNDTTAWFADDIAGSSVDSVLYDQTNLFGGFRIDFITPGRINLAPSAAAGTVSGRVLSENGRGFKFVTVMITGNGLPEPLYATTNSFGQYQFDELPVGETYVLQVFSKRYTFKQSSRLINLDDSVTNADFIGIEGQ